MSWEPAWVPDGRGGFRRNRAKSINDDVEEGEESDEAKQAAKDKKGGKGDDDEEEGEITPLPSSGGPLGLGLGPLPPRSSSTGNLDFRAPYRGRAPNNSRFVANRDRPRQRNSFSGTMPSQRYQGPSSNGNASSGREGFAGAGRDSQPPPPPPPPPSFREPSSFREAHSNRDIMDGPHPRAGREFRDFGQTQPSSNLRGDSTPFCGRDFRDKNPPGRDFTDRPHGRDFRGEQAPPPPRDVRDLRGVDHSGFRGDPPVRDFRDPTLPRDYRGPSGPPEPTGREYRNDGSSRDFRGPSDPMSRDYRGGDGPSRDFRDRGDGIGMSNRDFRGGNPPPKRDVFGRDSYQNPGSDRPPAGVAGGNDNRESFNTPPLQRDPPSFGSSKAPAVRDQSPYRDGALRNAPFREGEPPYRDPPGREGGFRDEPREVPYHEGVPRDPREVTSKDVPFQGVTRDRDIAFSKRDGIIPNGPRDTGRETAFGNRDQYQRGESHADRGHPSDGPPFENTMRDHKREASFGAGLSSEPNFGPKRLDSGVARDQSNRIGGAPSGQRIVAQLNRDGKRDTPGFHVSNVASSERECLLGKNVKKSTHHRVGDIALGQGSNSAPLSGFPSGIGAPTLGIGLPGSKAPTAARPTDPRRRPSKELAGSSVQQGISSTLMTQDGNASYPQSSDPRPSSNLVPSLDNLPEKPPIPPISHPTRRMGSYSSLADNSSMTTTLLPTPPPPDRANSAGSRLGSGGFRSPLPRRLSSDSSPRNERGDYYGPPGGPTPGRLRSPASERGRSLGSGPAPSPNNVGAQNVQPSPTSVPQHPPLAPVMTGRPAHFRQNDPRLKHHERTRSENDAACLQALGGRDEVTVNTKNCFDSRSESESLSGRINEVDSEKSSQTFHVDTFGRTRDWTESPKSLVHSASNAPADSSPQPASKSMTGPDQGKSTTGIANEVHSCTESATLPVANRNDKKRFSSEVPDEGNVSSAGSASIGSSIEGTKSKSENLPQLLTSSLGDDTVVKRAEAAMRELELVNSTEFVAQTSTDDQSELPTKQQIMAAVTELEKLIKESQRTVEDASKKRNDVLKEEDEDCRRALELLDAEEERRVAEKEKRAVQRKQEVENLKTHGLQKAIADNEEVILVARRKLEEELQDQISQAKDDERKRCFQDMEGQMWNAATGFDRDIAKARRDLEKAKSAALNIESKVSHVEVQYRALLGAKGSNMLSERGSRDYGVPSSTVGAVLSITAENKRKAAEAQMLSMAMLRDGRMSPSDSSDYTPQTTDPQHGRTFEEWHTLATRVTGVDDALYSEPSESPYFDRNKRVHLAIGPSVKEYIRDKRQRLLGHWTQLAEEYEVRKRLYEKQQKKLTRKAQRGSISVAGRKSILGNKETGERPGFERVGVILESSSRPSNNPYRRARRGNEVRSEYEQDLIIAEIAAKEAMEKRIAHGSSKVPRQICRVERELSASYVNTFTAHRVDDPLQEAQAEMVTNVWSDMEKCIFLDRFLQFPKDFRRIASFLRNKTTKDCVAFYYDSKQSVQYKGALKEHMMRRKRRGDYQVWDASVQSAISMGAAVTAGSNMDKPLVFSLPPSDGSFHTRWLHPLRRGILDSIVINEKLARTTDGEENHEDVKPRSRKRSRDPLFALEKAQTKYLCQASQESLSGMHFMKVPVDSTKAESEESSNSHEVGSAVQTPIRKAPQKWSAAEKKIFLDTLEEHGRDWAMLAKAVGTKSISQIKNFYYDFKKQSGKYKPPSEKKAQKADLVKARGVENKDIEIDKHSKSPKDPDIEHGLSTESEPRTLLRFNDPGKSKSQDGDNAEKGCKSARGRDNVDGAQKSSLMPEHSMDSSPGNTQNHDMMEPAPTSISNLPPVASHDYSDSNHALLHQLLTQQLQQHHHHHHQQDMAQHRQPIQQQRLHVGQQPQSAIQQILSQHHQRDNQQGQAALEEVHRLLQQQQTQSHHQQALSNLLPWVTASQLLQNQARLQHPHQDGNQITDMNDVANIQRLLQIQQSQPNFGVNTASHNALGSLLMSAGARPSASSSGIASTILSQLDQIGTSGSSEATAGISTALSGGPGLENLSAITGAQGLLGFGAAGHLSGSNSAGLGSLAGAGIYRQAGADAPGVSEALNLLTGAMPRRDGPAHGFGGAPERGEGGRFQ